MSRIPNVVIIQWTTDVAFCSVQVVKIDTPQPTRRFHFRQSAHNRRPTAPLWVPSL